MRRKIRKILIVLILCTLSLPFIKGVKKVSADEIKADILNLQFSNGSVIDTSDYKWDVILSQTPTFENVLVTHQGMSYSTTAFVKDYINEGLTINWRKQYDSEIHKKFADGFTMTFAVQIDELLVSSQDRILFGNGASGGVDIILTPANKFLFEIHTGSRWASCLSPDEVIAGELYYLTAVYSSTDAKIYMYINGELVASDDAEGYRQSTKYGMSVGGVCDGADPTGIAYTAYRSDNGKYVNASIYSKDLTLEEVKNEYNKFIDSMTAIEKNPNLLNVKLDANGAVDEGTKKFELAVNGTYKFEKCTFMNNMRTYELFGYHKDTLSQGIVANYTNLSQNEFDDLMKNSFTMSTAFSIEELSSGERVMFGIGTTSGVQIIINENNKIQLKIHNGSEFVSVESQKTVELNKLYYVTVTYDTKKASLYINGGLIGEVKINSYENTSTKAISLGGICNEDIPTEIDKTMKQADKGYYFVGKIYSDVLADVEVSSAYRTFMKQANEVVSDSVKKTIEAINAIGEVTVESGTKITTARERYDNLNEYEKTQITNYTKLTEAEYLYRIFNRAEVTFNSDNITTKLGVISDTHIGYPGMEESYERALRTLNEMSGGLDGIINAGDMTQDGLAEQTKTYLDVTKKVIDINKTPVISCYGNHDTYWSGCMNTKEFMNALGKDYFKFDENLADSEKGNRHVIINGYHFLTVQTQTYMPGNNVFSQETRTWLDQTIKTIVTENPNAPVFVIGHSPVLNTIFGSYEDDPTGVWGANAQLDEIFKKYPQVTYFSGHTHYVCNDERSIMQDNYTSVLVSSAGDIELQQGRIEGASLPNRRTYSSGMLMEIDNLGNVRLTRIDFVKDQIIKDSWIIPAPSENNLHLTYYTKYRATQNNENPTFASDAEILVEKTGATAAKLTFTNATDDDMVYDYKITILDGENNVVKEVRTLNHFWDYPNVSDTPKLREVEISNITLAKPYTIEIVAYDSWGNASEKLSLYVEDTSEKDKAAAKVVADAINEIGDVTENSKTKIDSIIEEYNKLNFEQKSYVENFDILLNAIDQIQKLYVTETEIENPVDDTWMASGSFGANNPVTGVNIAWKNGSYNSSIGLSKTINLDDFYLTLENLNSTSSHFDLGLLFNDNMKAVYSDGNSMLLWFDFVAGTMHLYPDAGGTKILESELLKSTSIGNSRIDIHIYKSDSGYEIEVKTFQGIVKGTLPAGKVALVTELKNPEKCYLTFSPWHGGANYSLTVRAMGNKANDYNYHSATDYKSVSMIRRNINSFPAEITLANETLVTMISDKYQLLDDYLKSLLTKEEVEKLESAVKTIEDLKKSGPVVPVPEPEDPEPSENTNNKKGCGCNKSSVLMLFTFITLSTVAIIAYRKKH